MYQMQILFNVREAAVALGIGRSSLYELLSNGDLKSVKIGQRRLVPRASIEAFVARLVAGV